MNSVSMTEDGSFVLAGRTDGDWGAVNSGGHDFAAVMLDADGIELWRWQVRGSPLEGLDLPTKQLLIFPNDNAAAGMIPFTRYCMNRNHLSDIPFNICMSFAVVVYIVCIVLLICTCTTSKSRH